MNTTSQGKSGMKKDVVYIDIEDDITSVIEKLKASKEKIIALVPPKGNAVLQSVVNLKLLKRAADQAGKQPVVVTNNQALTALAGGLDLYVAKNLQSKPVLASEVAEAAESDDLEVSDDPIEDEVAPVVHDNSASGDVDSDEVELSGEELAGLQPDDAGAAAAAGKAKKPPKGKKDKKKLPNFDNFRKKLLIGGGIALALLVVLFLIFGRAKATIVVRADTTPVDVAFNANLNTASQTSDPTTYNLKAVAQQSKKTLSQSFSATGQKDIGQKATGTVKFTKNTPGDTTIAAGTQLTASNGKVFTVNSSTALPGAQLSFTCPGYLCPGSATTNVTAAEGGTQYNGVSGSVGGAPSGSTASFTGSTSGGTTQVVQVVTQADVNKAKDALSQQDTNQVKSDLKKSFPKDTLVFDDSLTTTLGSVNAEPAVGQQANDGKLSAEATYTILGVPKSDMGAALDAFITTKMTNKDQQRVYDNGLSNIKLEKVDVNDKTAVYKVSTTAQYGPQFDTDQLKDQIKGKKFGEARSYLQGLPGVKGVDISLTPFWARTLPNAKRISIKLDVNKNAISQ